MQKSVIPILLLIAVVGTISVDSAFAQVTTTTTTYSCDSPSPATNEIHIINQTDSFNPITSNSISVSGFTSQGCVGLAQHPISEVWYIALRENGGDSDVDNYLATINPENGTGTLIGTMSEGINAIHFNATGHLFGFPNSQASSTNTIFSINTSTGASSSACDITAFGGAPSTFAYNWDDDNFYAVTAWNDVEGQINQLTDMDASDCGESGWQGMESDYVPSPENNIGLPQSMAYDTITELFYMFSQSDSNTEMQVSAINYTGLTNNLVFGDSQTTGGNSFEGTFQRGLGFVLSLFVDTTDPVISATESEPITIIQDSVFDEFEFVTCIDDTDGDITNSMTTMGTVDTSDRNTYIVEYNCVDTALNESDLEVEYIVKRVSTGSGAGGSGVTSNIGGQTDAQTSFSNVPTLSFSGESGVSPETPQLGSTFFEDLYASFFQDTPERQQVQQQIDQNAQQLGQQVAETAISTATSIGSSERTTQIGENLFDNIVGFFSGFLN